MSSVSLLDRYEDRTRQLDEVESYMYSHPQKTDAECYNKYLRMIPSIRKMHLLTRYAPNAVKRLARSVRKAERIVSDAIPFGAEEEEDDFIVEDDDSVPDAYASDTESARKIIRGTAAIESYLKDHYLRLHKYVIIGLQQQDWQLTNLIFDYKREHQELCMELTDHHGSEPIDATELELLEEKIKKHTHGGGF